MTDILKVCIVKSNFEVFDRILKHYLNHILKSHIILLNKSKGKIFSIENCYQFSILTIFSVFRHFFCSLSFINIDFKFKCFVKRYECFF